MKKTISILLAVLLVVSCAVVASAYSVIDPDVYTVDEAVAEHELIYGEEVETNRYYFLMPTGTNGDLGDDDSVDDEGNPTGKYGEFAPTWYLGIENEDGSVSYASDTAGIYWWDSGVADPTAWAGYLPSGSDPDDPNVYYADVPVAATTIIWNNGVDGGMDTTLPIYYSAAQTVNIGAEYYDPGESDNYPDGTTSFDGMIYVVDPDLVSISDFSLKQTCGGEWYYYYGNGCYGFTEGGSEADCLRDDHYDADGNHVVTEQAKPTPVLPEIPTEEPTDAPTDAPTTDEPTDAPTDAPTDEPTEPTQAPTPGDFVLGDADGDGEVSVMDASLIQMYLVGKKDITGDAALAADADKDGEISVMDASLIQMYLVGKKDLG